jgi:hypothetical protein
VDILVLDKVCNALIKKFITTNRNASDMSMEPGIKLGKDENGKPISPILYGLWVGSLIYLTITRLNIKYVVGMITRYLEKPKISHCKAIEGILRYLKNNELGVELFLER